MISIPHKAKQFLTVLAKLFIVGGALYFIYKQLAHNDKLDWGRFIIQFRKNQSVFGILFILFLSFANRFLEILKWQNLASTITPITIKKSTEQVLAALTASIFTPNGIGEYGAKALYFDKKEAKKVVFLNLICNGIQLLLSVVMGIIGLLVFNHYYTVVSNTTLGIITAVILFTGVLFFSLKKITIRGYSIQRIWDKVNALPRSVHQKNILLGCARYLIFSHQYYFLFRVFDVELPYILLMATIFAVYFLASSLPTFQFLDFAVKGSVAVFFFGLLGVNEWIAVFVSTLMWFLNVVLPVVIGSYYVINFKSKWKS